MFYKVPAYINSTFAPLLMAYFGNSVIWSFSTFTMTKGERAGSDEFPQIFQLNKLPLEGAPLLIITG